MGSTGEVVTDKAERFVSVLADSEQIVATMSRYDAGESGPDPHIHRHHTDSFHVLGGELVFEVAEERITAPAGTFVSVPAGVVHTFRNEGPAAARFLNFHTPGCNFAAHLRGEDVDFDTEDPPEDGGRPAGDAVVVRPD